MKKSSVLLNKKQELILEFLAKFGVAHDRHIFHHLKNLKVIFVFPEFVF